VVALQERRQVSAAAVVDPNVLAELESLESNAAASVGRTNPPPPPLPRGGAVTGSPGHGERGGRVEVRRGQLSKSSWLFNAHAYRARRTRVARIERCCQCWSNQPTAASSASRRRSGTGSPGHGERGGRVEVRRGQLSKSSWLFNAHAYTLESLESNAAASVGRTNPPPPPLPRGGGAAAAVVVEFGEHVRIVPVKLVVSIV
jgi:hypothetical protein